MMYDILIKNGKVYDGSGAEGFVADVAVLDGKIAAMIVPRPSGLLGLSHANDLAIPWNKIECIGEDAILIKIPQSEMSDCECLCRSGKKGRFFK